MLIQSFLMGVMRCGGIAIRLVSDFSAVDWAAAAGRAGNDGTESG